MSKKQKWILIAAVILTACCLRGPITGVGSLIGLIKDDFNLANSTAGMITTIPLLTFAVVSIIVGKISQKIGAGRILLISMGLMMVGIICRSYLGLGGLFIGTIIIGIGIPVGNVLIPAIIKAYFPEKVGILTSLYTSIQAVFSGIATGISFPIANAYGWKVALVIWLALVAVAFLSWIPNLYCVTTGEENLATEPSQKDKSVLRSGMAWSIAIYMGVQSLVFYGFVAWLVTILEAKGFDAQTAGYFSSAYMIISIPGSFIVPIIAARKRSQVGLGLEMGAVYIIGMVAMLFSNNTLMLIIAVALCGFCSGATFSFTMALIGLHTKNAKDAAALSGLSQSVGYLLAAIGPALMGKLFDMTGSWTIPLVFLLIVILIITALSLLIGRDKIINE